MSEKSSGQSNGNREPRISKRAIQWLGSHLLKVGVKAEGVKADQTHGYMGPIVMIGSDTYEFDGAPTGTSSMAREGTYAVADAMLQEFKDDAASGEYRYKRIGSSMAFDTDLIIRRVEETAAKVRGS